MRHFLIIMLLILGLSTETLAEHFRLQHPERSSLVGRSLYFAVDESGTWTPETVLALSEDLWTRSQAETPNFGYLKHPLWVRVALENASAQRDWILSFPDASFVQIAIWKKGPQTLEHLYTMDRSRGVAGRPIKKRYYNIPLELEARERVELFVRFEFQTTSSVPIAMEGRESFEANYFLDTVLQSLYFGIMLSMFFYNGFLFITTYDRSYLYYICYVLSLSLMMLWVRDWFSLLSPPGFVLTAETCNSFGYGVLLFGALFVINFVQDYLQNWILTGLRWMRNLCLPLIACLYLYDNAIFNQVALVTLAVLMLSCCVIAIVMAYIRNRNRQTFNLLLAWSCVLLGGILFSFNRNGLLPQTVFFDYSVQFGSALEVLLLSFSLGDKINSERDQKLLAQQQIEESEKLAQQARAVQDALIHDQQRIPGVEIARFYQSADTTGGDWYGVFYEESSQRLYLFMGDVTGHGIPSALVTAAVSGAIQSLVDVARSTNLSRDQALESIAQAVNRVVRLTGEKTDRIMTMAFICVDLMSMEGTFLNAGHRPPYLVQSSGIKPLMCRGNMLGVLDHPEFEHKDFQLTAGSSLFLYTDGLFENRGSNGEAFREKQLYAALQDASLDPGRVMTAIASDLDRCWQKTQIGDDCALLLIRFNRQKAQSGTGVAS